MAVRICVAIDFITDDPVEAYRSLYEVLKGVENITNLVEGWETTDEWFDKYGEPLNETQIGDVRMKVIDERLRSSEVLRGD